MEPFPSVGKPWGANYKHGSSVTFTPVHITQFLAQLERLIEKITISQLPSSTRRFLLVSHVTLLCILCQLAPNCDVTASEGWTSERRCHFQTFSLRKLNPHIFVFQYLTQRQGQEVSQQVYGVLPRFQSRRWSWREVILHLSTVPWRHGGRPPHIHVVSSVIWLLLYYGYYKAGNNRMSAKCKFMKVSTKAIECPVLTYYHSICWSGWGRPWKASVWIARDMNLNLSNTKQEMNPLANGPDACFLFEYVGT